MVAALDPADRELLNGLLKRMLTRVESAPGPPRASTPPVRKAGHPG